MRPLLYDGDLRMLGAADGFAAALVYLRQQVKPHVAHPYRIIQPHHTRKIAQQRRELELLGQMERFLEERLRAVQDAYQASRHPSN